jgi:hypothetical protein
LLNARLRLANVEQDRDAVGEQLRALIKIHQEILPIVRDLDATLFPVEWERHFRNAIHNELERDRWRLEQLRQGQYVDDLAAAALDS